jgi:transcriptional regulator with XRE-family HTH domain
MTDLSIPTAEQIQEAAKSKGWSIKRLCSEAGITHATFFRWRDGKNEIGVNKLQRLIDVLKRPQVDPQ